MLSRRGSRQSRTSIAWSGRRWWGNMRCVPSIRAVNGGSARTDWAGITKVRFGCSAISTEERAAADYSPPAHRQTGAASPWRSSAESNWSKMHGTQRRTIPARKPALRKSMWMRKISRSGWLHKRDSAAAARAVDGQGRSARWRWRMGYAARDGRGDPRGRKSGDALGADSPTWPARAEGGKRALSLIRNP